MAAVLADTHAVVWYLLASPELSPSALRALDDALRAGDGIYVSVVTLIEVIYLVEKGKLQRSALDELERAVTEAGEGLREVPVDLSIARAVGEVPRDLVPDMPNRIIAATARHLDLPLVTRDTKLQAAGIQAIW